MTKRFALAMIASAALAFVAAPAFAHEGHDHTVLGTVSMIHDAHLLVKDADGRTMTFMLDAKTKVLKGTTVMTRGDITSGIRIAVTAEETKDASGKTMMMAKEVRLGETPKAADASAAAHDRDDHK